MNIFMYLKYNVSVIIVFVKQMMMFTVMTAMNVITTFLKKMLILLRALTTFEGKLKKKSVGMLSLKSTELFRFD
jgi:hypothetical protein